MIFDDTKFGSIVCVGNKGKMIQAGKIYSLPSDVSAFKYVVTCEAKPFCEAMYERKIPEDLECGINITMKVLGGKWKPCIIDSINKNIRRPSELHAAVDGAAPRVINIQLRELEQYGIVDKIIHPGLPLKVEYFLTALGESILPIVLAMDQWGQENQEEIAQRDQKLTAVEVSA